MRQAPSLRSGQAPSLRSGQAPSLRSGLRWPGVIEQYRRFLPVSQKTPVVTLLEGNTPLLPAVRLGRRAGPRVRVFLKCEGFNPTGSFKDRGMTVAVSKALERRSRAVMCASTGNTSASAAAYAARAGLPCVVLIPQGAVAMGKLAQALIHGAQVLMVKGNFDAALQLVKMIAQTHHFTLVNSINPFRLEGQKTGAFEVCDHLGGVAPDLHVMPVGNAGNITAYWKGYREYYHHRRISALPRMLGFQAAGAAPLVAGHPIAKPQTIATAIRIGHPASWQGAIRARDESGGLIDSVTDREILAAYRLLAEEEGMFAEPASCAAIAGLLKLAKRGGLRKWRAAKRDLTVVCVLTGHGLKDPEMTLKVVKPPKVVPPEVKAILREIT